MIVFTLFRSIFSLTEEKVKTIPQSYIFMLFIISCRFYNFPTDRNSKKIITLEKPIQVRDSINVNLIKICGDKKKKQIHTRSLFLLMSGAMDMTSHLDLIEGLSN